MVDGPPPVRKPDGESAYVNPDSMEPVESLATNEGKIFDSKSALRRHYAELGYEEGSLKGEKERAREARDYKAKMAEERRSDVAEAIRRVRWGMAPLSERERAKCQEEKRTFQEWKKRNRIR